MQAPLPVITSHIADRRDRGYLAWVAVANEVATLHLDAAPIDATPHALEIHVEGFDEPLVVLAEPAGEPTSQGFPLRLRPFDEAQADALRAELFGGGAPAHSPPGASADAVTITEAAVPSPRQTEQRPIRSLRPASEPPPMSARHREVLKRSTMGAGPPSSRREERREPGSLTGRVIGDGRFSLDSLIGAGASGEVYRGTHAALRRAIAVKVLHPALQNTPDYCARFYSEALAASQLDHRNVMRVIDYGQEPDGLLYIVMELLEGQSLETIVHQEAPLPTSRIVHLISQACAGLAHAHDANVVHRDIKPENIVIVRKRDDEGKQTEIVKVCDFGIAHWKPRARSIMPGVAVDDDADTLVNKPDDSKVVGTPAYMAPEQIRNDAVDARADVYALGVVLYELATGRVPFDSPTAMEVLMHHLNVEPTPPSAYVPDIDPALERVIMKALQKDPAQRQEDARVLRAELKALEADDTSAGVGASSLKVSLKNLLVPSDFLDLPGDTLARLSAIKDAHSRGVGIDALGQALRAAVEGAQIPVAKELFAWLQARVAAPATDEAELEQIDRAQRVLRDPQTTATLATAVLDGRVARVEDAAPLLAVGGPVAARALIEARRAQPPTLELRARFVGALRSIGAPSLPAIVAALEPLIQFTTRAEEALAEDLLRGVPETPSDGAGEVTVRFVRVDKPSLAVLAIAATTAAWGRRAKPLLVGVLDSRVEVMRTAAFDALCKLGDLDDSALERLARMVLGQIQVADELRVRAAEAFALAAPESRARALTFLEQRLQPAQGIMSSVRQVFAKGENPAVTIAIARALVALDATRARPIIERFAASRTDLRFELDEVLKHA